MKWQRAARLVVAFIGIGTAVAIYMSTRPRPAEERPGVPGGDPAANVESGAGRDLRFDDQNRQIADLGYTRQRGFPDGRVAYEDLRLELGNGTLISAKSVEASGKAPDSNMPVEWKLKGDVKFTASDQTSLAGEEATYNHTTGMASIPGAVTFTRGRFTGTGTGGAYERGPGTFKLLADAKVSVPADAAGAGQLEATAGTMTFVTGVKTMLFEGAANIARPAETMAADRATLYLSPDEQHFQAVELRGQARVTPVPGKPSDTPEMHANDIDLGFHEGGQALQRGLLMTNASMVMTSSEGRRSIEAPHINFAVAPDGKTLTRLDARDRVIVKTPARQNVPERTITAATLAASGNERAGLTAAFFEGNVEFVELVPAANGGTPRRRVGTSQALTLSVKGNLDTIEEAQFQRNAKFQDGSISGDADLGVYRAGKGELELHPLARNPQRMPHVEDGNVRIDATELIRINLDSHDVFARRDVKTMRLADSNARPSPSGLFNGRDAWSGSGSELHYTARTKTLRYLGNAEVPARIRQGDTSVTGRDVTVAEERQDLSASGAVESIFFAAGQQGRAGGASAAGTRYHVTSDTLVYTDSTRKATYVGGPAILRTNDGVTQATTLVLVMAAAERKLETLEATTSVRVTQEGGRVATGNHLLYEAAKDQYTLRGTPVTLPVTLQMTDAEGKCSIVTGTLAVFVGRTGTPDFPAAMNPGGSVIKPCPDAIKP